MTTKLSFFPYSTLFRSGGGRIAVVRGKAHRSTVRFRIGPTLRARRGAADPPLPGSRAESWPDAKSYRRSESFPDRKSTRLNSSHVRRSYAVFCLKKKNR